MIDTQSETLLSLSEAAAAVPAVDGKRPHTNSVWRWVAKGVRGVRLEHVRVGRRVCTTREALDRFMNAVAQAPAPQVSPNHISQRGRTRKQREHDMAKARERLRRNGVTTGGAA